MPTEVLQGRSSPIAAKSANQKQRGRPAVDRTPTKINEGQRHDDLIDTPGQRLQHRRAQLDWTQANLAWRMLQVGAWYEGGAQYISSLVSMISSWEHDRVVPEPYNRYILAETLGMKLGELGFPIDPHYVHPPRRQTPLPLDYAIAAGARHPAAGRRRPAGADGGTESRRMPM